MALVHALSDSQVQVAGIRDFSLGNLAGNVFRGKREAGVFGFIGELDPFFLTLQVTLEKSFGVFLKTGDWLNAANFPTCDNLSTS